MRAARHHNERRNTTRFRVRAGISLIAAAGALLTLAGCTAPARHPGFDSPDPVDRTLAAQRAVETNDQTAIPHLITMLASSDPAVRMVAQRSLERLTGQSLGYDHAASELQRQAAIDRWVAWYESEAGPSAAGAPRASQP